MEHNFYQPSSRPADGAPVEHAGESVDRKKRRRRHRHGKKQHETVATATESAVTSERRGPQFFTSAQRPAATIWERPVDEVDTPEAITETARVPEPALTQPDRLAKPKLADDLSWLEQFAAAPYDDPRFTAPRMPSASAHAPEQVNEPHQPFPPTRRYFWNEPEAAGSAVKAHESLPSVTQPDQAKIEPESTPKPPPAPELTPPQTLEDIDAASPENVTEPPTKLATNDSHEAAPTKSQPVNLQPEAYASEPGRAADRAVQSPMMENNAGFEGAGVNVDDALFVAPAEAELAPAEEDVDVPMEAADFPVIETAQSIATPRAEAISSEAWADLGEAVSPSTLAPAETPSSEKLETHTIAEHSSGTAVEHVMDRNELLVIADSIRVDGVNVHEMFLAGRLDEPGLRRIVTAYMRGAENLKQLIIQELTRQQMRFERDPQLRTTPVGRAKSKTKVGSGKAKRAASSIKNHAKSLLDAERAHGGTERIAEATQATLEKAHDLFSASDNASRNLGIAAIAVIYLAIVVVLFLR